MSPLRHSGGLQSSFAFHLGLLDVSATSLVGQVGKMRKVSLPGLEQTNGIALTMLSFSVLFL
jgi:hypothetical protein